ncbi:MarR family winged helix-turn-helix transcriptional regulator [Acetobacterium wieringae]|uniref:MarR family winged helix-turn-helix transcriptional regulator n=1 Tax=Acetobacterium wieringae TaxID=52694 RepID=UPI0020340851|nr:MarR family winged helix-turn-helix transcriptional regulator [Acetobacterium wieringae]URN84381.1 MarR family winged helix-turn-helix transcriptional regulator [Acetobacterium wieringae]
MTKIEPLNSPCYCINFRQTANSLTKYYDKGFSQINLTANQFFLLNSIHQLESCNKSRLAKYTRLDRTTIIRNLDILIKKGLIVEVTGTTKRNKEIELTTTGQNAIASGTVIWQLLQSEVKQHLGVENLDVLWRIFENLETLEN